MDKTFELYDKGVKIIDSIDRYGQCDTAFEWLWLARIELGAGAFWNLKRRLDGKIGMFSAP